MTIKGWQGVTTLDFPKKIACILFTGGCNLRCSFCHNMPLVEHPNDFPTLPEEEALAKVKARKGFIDGVVISGGEPTIQNGLNEFLTRLKKETGLAIKLDTNGLLPDRVEGLLRQRLLDYVALDIKTSPSNYAPLLKADWPKAERTMVLLRQSGLPYEYRTTCAQGYVNRPVITEIAGVLRKGEFYFLQPEYKDGEMLSDLSEIKHYKTMLKEKGIDTHIRGFED